MSSLLSSHAIPSTYDEYCGRVCATIAAIERAQTSPSKLHSSCHTEMAFDSESPVQILSRNRSKICTVRGTFLIAPYINAWAAAVKASATVAAPRNTLSSRDRLCESRFEVHRSRYSISCNKLLTSVRSTVSFHFELQEIPS